LAHFWKIGAIHKKIHIKRHPVRPVSFFFRQNHFHHFALRPPLLAADSVGVDVHAEVAVGVALQREEPISLLPCALLTHIPGVLALSQSNLLIQLPDDANEGCCTTQAVSDVRDGLGCSSVLWVTR